VVGEVMLPVTFVLLGRPGTTLDDVLVVATHPHAEAQCRTWLRENLPEAEVVLTPSTADAARAVARNRYDAAVAAPNAAEHYGLSVLADEVQDREGVTRFFLVTATGPDGCRPDHVVRDPSAAEWAYVFQSTGSGCTVTETWTDRRGRAIKLLGRAATGVKDRAAFSATSIEQTRAGIKAVAEGGPTPVR